jgi:Tol biopolymer transport system component
MMHRNLLSASLLLALAACGDNTGTPLAPAEGDSGETLAAAVTALPGRLVFDAVGAQGMDLFTINPDGTGRALLVTGPGNNRAPAWSWDNQSVAFIRSRPDASNVQHGEVFLVDKNGGNGHWLTAQPLGIELRDPAWSPDGSRILVGTTGLDMLSIDVATGQSTTLPYQGNMPSFDATGQLITFSTPSVIRVAKADGSGIIRSIFAPSGAFVQYARFSPDGKKIAFNAYPVAGENSDIWLVNADGTGLTRLVGGRTEDTRPTWSPDGQTIAYTSSRRDNREVWRVPVSGGHKTRITSGGAESPSWTH